MTGFLDAVLTVIRTADATTTTIPLCFRPEGVVVGSDGCHLYIADPMGSRIAVLDTTDHSMEFLAVGNQPFRRRSAARISTWATTRTAPSR